MTLQAAQGSNDQNLQQQLTTPDSWKKTVSETLLNLHIIPERFNGKVVVSFKNGGVSYLEKSETLK